VARVLPDPCLALRLIGGYGLLTTYFQTVYFSFNPLTHAKKVVPFGG
jgi:hypothetical protein